MGNPYNPPQQNLQPPFGRSPPFQARPQRQPPYNYPPYQSHPYQYPPQYNQPVTTEESSIIKNKINQAWQGLLGFGNRTRSSLNEAKDQVQRTASHAGQSISSTSSSLWEKTKSTFDTVGNKMFEEEKYSLSSY